MWAIEIFQMKTNNERLLRKIKLGDKKCSRIYPKCFDVSVQSSLNSVYCQLDLKWQPWSFKDGII